MDDAVKTTRGYNSSRRQQQAADTRKLILESAKRLFERGGYVETTMQSIAVEAGVVSKTVYAAFKTKGGLLSALWDTVLRGDENAPPVANLAWYREMLEAKDPRTQLRLNARNSRAVKERVGTLFQTIRDGSIVDPEAAKLWSDIQSSFHRNQQAVVESIHAKQALRSELDVATATDILWALNHPDVWSLLAIQRGWRPSKYEEWFADIACSQLLKPE